MELGDGTGGGDGAQADADEFDPIAVLLGPAGAQEFGSSAELANLLVTLEQEKLREPRGVTRYLPDGTGIEGGVCSICSSWIDDEVLDEFGYCARCTPRAVRSVDLLSHRIPFAIEREPTKVRRGANRSSWFPRTRRRGGSIDGARMRQLAMQLLRTIYYDEYRFLLELIRAANGYEPDSMRPKPGAFVLDEIFALLRTRERAEALAAEECLDR